MAEKDTTPTPSSPLHHHWQRQYEHHPLFSQINQLKISSQSMPTSPRLLSRRHPMVNKLSSLSSACTEEDGNLFSSDENASDSFSIDEEEDGIDWQKKFLELRLKLHMNRHQAERTRDSFSDQVSKLEKRVLEAEHRAEDAQVKVCAMEQKLALAQHNDTNSTDIHRLEGEVEEQRQLRLQDARQVEAKAARIKEWVTFKLRELEQQNQTLREQNIKCNQQLELLRKHLALTDHRRRSGSSSPELSSSQQQQLHLLHQHQHHHHQNMSLGNPSPKNHHHHHHHHRRHQSMCLSGTSSIYDAGCGSVAPSTGAAPVRTSQSSTISDDLNRIRAASGSASDPDLASAQHDYAEIFTPCADKMVEWGGATRAPTPPMHRFPSWEDRIYQVASDGLMLSEATPPAAPMEAAVGGAGAVVADSDRCYQNDVPVPVYATVKGRASQIRSVPFTGDSSDDTSDEECNQITPNVTLTRRATNATVQSSDESSAPNKDRSNSIGSGSSQVSLPLPKTRVTSFGSSTSDDYAVPPDALSYDAATPLASSICLGGSLDSSTAFQLTNTGGGAGCVTKSTGSDAMIEKCGWLSKLGGKLKTWRKKWFILRNDVLSYYKSDSSTTKAQGYIQLGEACRISAKADGSNTFEIATAKKMYHLTADTVSAVDEWVRTLQQVQNRIATEHLLNSEASKSPTIQSWLTKVKNGHSKKYWCVLIGRMLFYYRQVNDSAPPAGQINVREARVEEIEHLSDSDSEEDREQSGNTIGIFPEGSHGPTYLLCSGQQEMDAWLYHLTVASAGGGSSTNTLSGTQFEQTVRKLMEVDGMPNSALWRHPVLQYYVPSNAKDAASLPAYFPLTTLSTEQLRTDAIKLFKCVQLFMSAAVDHAGIDYHVVLAQNALQQCLETPPLQAELLCALIKQTSGMAALARPASALGITVAALSPATDSCGAAAQVSTQKLLKKSSAAGTALSNAVSPALNAASTTAAHTSSTNTTTVACTAIVTDAAGDPKPQHGSKDGSSRVRPAYTLLQGWQLLALAVSLFVPKSSRLLWFLRLHLQRNSDNSTEYGKYAAYCSRALERTIQAGGRELRPSRMEVLSILLRNPQHHSLPHSMPVHLLITNTYHITSFDGTTTIREFQETLAREIGCRPAAANGFALYSDDPIEKDVEQYVDPGAKLCDLIAKWESVLREKGMGKFENSKVIKLTYRNRLWWRNGARLETDKERLLLTYQVNRQIVAGRFPLNHELALELAAVMAQLDMGDYQLHGSSKITENGGSGGPSSSKVGGSGGGALTYSNQTLSALDRFYPYRYRDPLNADALMDLQARLAEKWSQLRGRTQNDCVRIYLTCTRKWPHFGATLFQAKLRQSNASPMVWLAVGEDAITILDLATMQQRSRYSYADVLTFGGCQEDFMLVILQHPTTVGQQLLDNNNHYQRTLKLTFMLSKPRILELTLLIADYMNLLSNLPPGTPLLGGTLNRGTMISVNNCSLFHKPDILKSTPDHHEIEAKRRTTTTHE